MAGLPQKLPRKPYSCLEKKPARVNNTKMSHGRANLEVAQKMIIQGFPGICLGNTMI